MAGLVEIHLQSLLSAGEIRIIVALLLILFLLCLAIFCVWSHNKATLSAIYLNPGEFEMGPSGLTSPGGNDAPGMASDDKPLKTDVGTAAFETTWNAADGTDDQPARVRVGAPIGGLPSPAASPHISRQTSASKAFSGTASPPRSPASRQTSERHQQAREPFLVLPAPVGSFTPAKPPRPTSPLKGSHSRWTSGEPEVELVLRTAISTGSEEALVRPPSSASDIGSSLRRRR